MKKLGISNIEESMDFLFERNLGNRNENLVNMLKLIDNIDDNMVLAIDGSWGTGKTVFVKQLEYLLKSGKAEKDVEISKNVLKQDPSYKIKDNCITVYYDAWKNDDHENPLESLLYSIAITFGNGTSEIPKSFSEKIFDVLKCANFSVPFIEVSTRDVKEATESKDILKEFKEKEQVKTLLKKALDELFISNNKNKMVVFIDELDRCIPTYAIKLLERIKHLFDDKRIVFIFSTNLAQLENTVKKYYGESFAACEYLDKIFDLRLELNEIEVEEYIEFLLQGNKKFNPTKVRNLVEIARYFGFGLRQCERYVMQMEIGNNYMDKIPINNHIMERIQLFVPIVLGIRFKSSRQYKKFINGENLEEFNRLLEKCPSNKNSLKHCVPAWREEFIIEKKIEEIYKTTFNDIEINRHPESDLASFKKEIIKTISLLYSNVE